MNGMIGFLRRQSWNDRILLAVALGCLIATAIQYPLSTTFHIGGDAAAHIATVQHLQTRPMYTLNRIMHSWYPVSYLLFSTLTFAPKISWTDVYPWWMALGQITTGLSVGVLARRMYGNKAGIIAMAIWGLTPITMTSFFEDATMGQLWSLPWIVLFFERLSAKSLPGMAVCALLALLSHPITGCILLATLMFTTINLWLGHHKFSKEEEIIRKIFTWITIAGAVTALYLLATRFEVLLLQSRESSIYIPELFHGFFYPWLLLSILGWTMFIILSAKHNALTAISLGSFFFLSFLLAANNYLGIGFWTNRVNAYLLICIVLGAAIGFSYIVETTKAPRISVLAAIFVLLGATISVWHTNANIYRRTESKTLYIRIHPEELEAIAWIRTTTPLHSIVFTSAITRHYEWIPVLSDREWKTITLNEIQSPKYEELENEKYITFFTRKERAPEYIRNNTVKYSLVYENKGSEIFQIIPTP